MSIKDLYSVRRLYKNESHEWLLKKHYAHRIPPISFSFGLYDKENILVGICTIGKPASNSLCEGICGKEHSFRVYELNRLCVNEGLEKNVLSFFVGRIFTFFRKGCEIIVSYADTGMGHNGYIYQATNWIYTGKTKERTDQGSENGKHSRHGSADLPRVKRSSKHRYVIFVGEKRLIKKVRKCLKYPILPYPKGDNKRYDASYNPSIQMILI